MMSWGDTDSVLIELKDRKKIRMTVLKKVHLEVLKEQQGATRVL